MMERLRGPSAAPPSPEGGGVPRFEQVYRELFDYVWHTLRRLGVGSSEREDLAHDVFVVVHRRLVDYDPARPMRPWLFGIAYRIASEHRRRVPQHADAIGVDTADLPDQRASPELVLASNEARQQVARALEDLPLEQRAVLVLHDIDGFAAPEIARGLDLPLNTVYSRLRLARAKFIHAIAGAAGEGEEA
jgi:RNA polymerase sigma-70 factor, ECF subfamily